MNYKGNIELIDCKMIYLKKIHLIDTSKKDLREGWCDFFN